MKSILLHITCFFLIGSLYSQNKSTINIQVLGCKENISVSLLSYNEIGKDIEFTTLLKNQKCSFSIPKYFNDGIYSVVVNFPASKNNTPNVYSFYVVIDSSESEIDVDYNFKSGNFPVFKKSMINQNWYSYLLEERKNFSILKNLESQKSGVSKMDEIKYKIKNSKELFLKQNFNFWSSKMVQYNDYDFLSTSVFLNENDFWSRIETNIPVLLNTPIYQNVIQKYVVLFNRNTTSVTDYKFIYESIIKRFSEEESIKSWVIKYIKYGISQTKNKELMDYFLDKY